jgi:hypothetical protein
VEGLATDDLIDLDDQIIDKDFARRELPKWFESWGNVRQMHSSNLPPAGKAVECTEVPGGHWVKTLVVEPTAKQLVKEGVYQAYSVGISKPRIVRDGVAKNGRVVDGVFTEISLVDFPANPRCKFEIAKRASATAEIEIVEKVFEPAVTKAASPADVAKGLVESGAAAGAVTADTVKARAAAEWYALVKRDMDPNVGGGVDRDKIPDDDFAGPHRSFPIVTPGDVSDAASSLGRAKTDQAGRDEIKARIIEIAHRKGKDFVAQLPEAWKPTEKAEDPEVEKARREREEGEKKPFPGAAKPFAKKDDEDEKDDAEKAAEPEVVKGARDCANCGDKHDADFEGKFCPGCGHKLPDVTKAAPYHRDPDETVECPHCHKYNSPDAKYCDQCGHKLPATKSVAADTEKRKDAEPHLEEHPEPDGDEDGPDLDRDEGGKGDATPVRTKSATPVLPYHLARLHDATCAAYHGDDVAALHPAVAKGIPSLVDVDSFADAVSKALVEDAGTGARIAEVPALSEAYGLAITLKAADAGLLDEAMADVRKLFEDMNPGARPKPTDITPGQFKRPYVSAGRAGMRPGKSPRIPLISHVPDPSKAAEADLTKGRTFYTNAARDEAQASLTAMHDYIAAQHPGICSMTDTDNPMITADGPVATEKLDTRQSSTLTPVSEADLASKVEQEVTKGFTPDAVQKMIADAVKAATEPLTEQLATLGKSVDEIARQPSVDAAAYRGSAVLQKVAGAAQTPAGRGDADGGTDALQDVVRLVKRAKHPSSEVSTPAMSELIDRVGADMAAALVG